MPRCGKKPFKNYSEQTMKNAIEDVQLHKTPIREAARVFGVPRATLKYKLISKSPIESKMGPPPISNKAEEDKICDWIIKMSAAAFHVTTDELTTSVQRFIIELKRKNPFKNDHPGRTWVKSFLHRNSTISKIISQNLTISQAAVTHNNIQDWFSKVNNYLEKNNICQI